jgi:hypothetical protein
MPTLGRPIITFKHFTFCFIETKIHHALTDSHKFINSSKYSCISIHANNQRLIIMYDIHMHFNLFNPTNDGSKYITTTFNVNT